MQDDDPDAIWRTDDVPIRSAPIGGFPVVPPAQEPGSSGPESGSAEVPGGIAFDAPVGDDEPHRRRQPSKRLIVAAAIAGILGVAAIVAVVGGGSDESSAPATTGDDSVPEPTAADATTTEPSTIPRPPSTLPAAGPERLELPPAVAAIQAPTEVIALTPGGLLHTLSLPSGQVRTVDLNGVVDGFASEGYGLVTVAPDAAALSTGNSVVIVPREGDPVVAELGGSAGGSNVEGWIRGDDGATRFVVTQYPVTNDPPSVVTVGADGNVADFDVVTDLSAFGPPTWLDGAVVVNDAGGAYRVTADGTATRVENGMVYADDGRHRLVRECDEARRCSTVVVDLDDGARLTLDPAAFPDEVRQTGFDIRISPDGTAASAISSGAQQERVIIDFELGPVAFAPSQTWLAGSTWAADSSGVFDVADSQLQFIGRDGESVRFGEELGAVVTIGVRRPDAELPPVLPVASAALTTTAPLGPTGLEFAAAGRTGGIGIVAIDALVWDAWQHPPLGRGSATVARSGEAVLAVPAGDSDAFLTSAAGNTPLGEAFATSDAVLAGPTDDTLWVPDGSAPSSDVRYRLLRLDGTQADDLGTASVDLSDATLLGTDGRGGLVVERRGSVFAVGVNGTETLTTGELIAIGATTAYVRECDSVDECPIVRIDRDDAGRTPMTGDVAVLERLLAVEGFRGAALGTTVSPDGDVLLTRVGSSDEDDSLRSTVLLDTVSGETVEVPRADNEQPIVWNDDSTFAALLTGSILSVYDRAEGRLVEVDGARFRAIGPG